SGSGLSPLPRRYRPRISPQAPFGIPRFRFQPLELWIVGRVPPEPPRKSTTHDLSIQVAAIWQDHISDRCAIEVLALRFNPHLLPEREPRNKLFSSTTEWLALLSCVDSIQ